MEGLQGPLESAAIKFLDDEPSFLPPGAYSMEWSIPTLGLPQSPASSQHARDRSLQTGHLPAVLLLKVQCEPLPGNSPLPLDGGNPARTLKAVEAPASRVRALS